MRERRASILVVGGGCGGFAAALAVARLGHRVVLTEETGWLGGQLTSQAVPPDEHPWMESTGCNASYRDFRNRVRAYYREHYPLTRAAHSDPFLNPGMGNVGLLCHEPRIGAAVLESMLAPYISSGQVERYLNCRPVQARSTGDRLESVVFHSDSGDDLEIAADLVLDATELGDVLELASVEHVVGAESQTDTDEPHALTGPPDPLEQQAISWSFAMDYLPGEVHTIDRPESYDFWQTYRADFWPGPQLGWDISDFVTHKPRHRPLFVGPTDEEFLYDLWHARRILYRRHFAEGFLRSDLTLANWPSMDYWLKPLVGVSEEERVAALEGCRQLSLSFLYWMQTAAPRPDGGQGFPGLRLRPDAVGTADGLAMSPYIREARRIKAEFTILEQHVVDDSDGGRPPLAAGGYQDCIGVGAYRLDVHPTTALRDSIDLTTWPFQIPLGALLPVRVDNLLPAAKNLGTTHLTNGCYRVHPVEWAIGEAAGALAAFSLQKRCVPRAVRHSSQLLHEFQGLLRGSLGAQLEWPAYEPLTSEKRLGYRRDTSRG